MAKSESTTTGQSVGAKRDGGTAGKSKSKRSAKKTSPSDTANSLPEADLQTKSASNWKDLNATEVANITLNTLNMVHQKYGLKTAVVTPNGKRQRAIILPLELGINQCTLCNSLRSEKCERADCGFSKEV